MPAVGGSGEVLEGTGMSDSFGWLVEDRIAQALGSMLEPVSLAQVPAGT